jgi:hypothetical protein
MFFASDFNVKKTTKDNTGKRQYIENMVFPTLSFPSDHGITSTILIKQPTSNVVSNSNNNEKTAIENKSPIKLLRGDGDAEIK